MVAIAGGHGQILLEKEKESKGALLLYKYMLPHFAEDTLDQPFSKEQRDNPVT